MPVRERSIWKARRDGGERPKATTSSFPLPDISASKPPITSYSLGRTDSSDLSSLSATASPVKKEAPQLPEEVVIGKVTDAGRDEEEKEETVEVVEGPADASPVDIVCVASADDQTSRH